MWALRALFLGAVAIGVVVYAIAAAAALAAQAGGHELHLAIVSLEIVSVASEGSAAVTSFGPGIPLIAFVGGLVNAAAACLMRRLAERKVDHVD